MQDDLISRQAVIDILDDMTKDYAKSNDFEKVNGVAWVNVQKLPPVNPQKIGHWIIDKWNNKEHYSCSSCQHVVDYEPCYHYCPYCGAKMVETKESEDE